MVLGGGGGKLGPRANVRVTDALRSRSAVKVQMRIEVKLRLVCREGFLWVLFLLRKVHELSPSALEAGSGDDVPRAAGQLCLLPPLLEGWCSGLPPYKAGS